MKAELDPDTSPKNMLDKWYTDMIISAMLARRITSLRSLPARLSPLHSGDCSLLALFFGSSPFRINNLQPLFANHPGWGTPAPALPPAPVCQVLCCLSHTCKPAFS